MKKFSFVIVGTLFLLMSCRTTTPSFYQNETQCLGVEMDGSQTLVAWGKGRYWQDGADQAKKNAVRDVIFKGLLIGADKNGCNEKPLLLEVNAREKYEDYFNAFFKDGGEYKNFVSLKDERIGKRILRKRNSRNQDETTYRIVVRVKRAELREKLINDGILKK
ncbi:MAG: hypothetical protein LBS50_00055 [Prevotellaceae bacterium]|jgi:hypothetical protein|nr:hypothetical protein [Prevotellaceae bacterium]